MISVKPASVPRRQAISLIGGGTLLCVLPSLPARAEGAEVGSVVEISGAGELGQATPFAPMLPGMEILLGDRAVTGPDGRAHLSLGQATQVYLGLETALVIDAFVAEAGGVIYLDGGMIFDRPEGADSAALAVETDFGRIGVRGTKFFIGPEPAHEGIGIFVERGEVVVQAAGEEVTLMAGDGTVIPEIGQPPRPSSKWKEERIRAALLSILGG